ncbi:hypothetical protein FGG08_000451 [Glutinoglossum americanum]|uniref:Uncharacterized protein n=1 Tax=Glutinoglossum americanum TaxID=1670608 RepID=A0A9P8ID48_9PEZI|nr:hypothetical protein FGG08_000451 [Glutinoglossum americanum]
MPTTTAPPPAPPTLLTLPTELRLKILTQAILALAPTGPGPFSSFIIPFDRPVLSIISLDWQNCSQSRTRDTYFGTEMMTRLMRVNRRIYEEVWGILYGDFAMHLAWSGPEVDKWLDWLNEHNPRAIEMVRHLHVRLVGYARCKSALGLIHYRGGRECQELVQGFPNLRSVRLQIFSVGAGDPRGAEGMRRAKEEAVERIMDAVKLFGPGVEVFVFCESREMTVGLEVVRECQRRLGQRIEEPFFKANVQRRRG